MPVSDGNEPDAGLFPYTGVRDKGNAHTGAYQIQSSLGGIDGTDNTFVGRRTGGPLLEALSHIVIKDDLWFMDDF